MSTEGNLIVRIAEDDMYPKILKYYGEELVVETVEKLEGGIIKVVLDVPGPDVIGIGSLVLSCGDMKIYSDSTYFETDMEGRIKRMEYFRNVPYANGYTLEFLCLDYIIPLEGEEELVLDGK